MKLFEHPEFEQAMPRAAQEFEVSEQFIEKGYYVTEILRTIAERLGPRAMFKGGASLSKGWGLIARFLREQGRDDMADDLAGFDMTLLHYRRTFVEKLFALHGKAVKFQQEGTPLRATPATMQISTSWLASTRFGRCSRRTSTRRSDGTTTRRVAGSSRRVIGPRPISRSVPVPALSRRRIAEAPGRRV